MSTRFVVGLDPSLVRAGITVLARHDDGTVRPAVLRDTGYSSDAGPTGWDAHSDRIAINARTVYQLLDKLPAKPDLVLVEAVVPLKEPKPSYIERCALWYGIWSGIKARNLPRTTAIPGTLKNWATGYGRAEKEDVLAEVSKWWPDVNIPNHDVADATVCAAMAAMRLGWRLPFPTRRRHLEGLQVVRWPNLPDAPDMRTLGSPKWTGV